MDTKGGDIPQWAETQLRSGLKLETSKNIRQALDNLSLEYVIDFFESEKNIPKNTAKTAYSIAMYQKALELLGFKPITVDGLYKMKNPNIESETKKTLKKFQTLHKIGVDGIPGPETATTIYEALKKLQKPTGKTIAPQAIAKGDAQVSSNNEGTYFKFSNPTPVPDQPIESHTPVTVSLPPKDPSFWEDVVSGFKSRFIPNK